MIAIAPARQSKCPKVKGSPVPVWGLPLAPFTLEETVHEVDRLIHRGKPRFFITANLNYAMLSAQHKQLRAVNARAAFIVADGMPLVWASARKGRRLPERVTGSDLLPALSARAATMGHHMFLLGGAPGVACVAAARLRTCFPGLRITASGAPHFGRLTVQENDALIDQVRRVAPDLLLLACGQPQGELWLADNCERLGVPVCCQVGAAIDFAAGRLPRAPHWVQRFGMEWAFRLLQEPARLGLRYLRNGLYLAAIQE
jgi:N-acetylglucosaminyldiphosphoundecaprenol N-acetyl-beta-D-mannosaminyltransferase